MISRKTLLPSITFALMASCGTPSPQDDGQYKVPALTFNDLDLDDTLHLVVGFDECGEFGGHIEWIKLFRSLDKAAYASLFVDTATCRAEKRTHRFLFRKKVRLNEAHKAAVVAYMKELFMYSLKKQDYLSNAGMSYIIRKNQENIRKKPETVARFYDPEHRWAGYDTLQKVLFK